MAVALTNTATRSAVRAHFSWSRATSLTGLPPTEGTFSRRWRGCTTAGKTCQGAGQTKNTSFPSKTRHESYRLNPNRRIRSKRLERPRCQIALSPACATLVGMRRIVWPLLSAVLVAAVAVCRANGRWPAGTDRHARTSRRARSTRGAIVWPPASSAPSRDADPESPRAWFGLGKSYEALARESFQKLQTTAPDSAWEALIVAEVLVSSERFAQALSLYREVQQAAPEIGGVHEAIADLYERAGKPEWARPSAPRPRHARATARRAPPSARYLAGKFLEAVAATEGRADARVALLDARAPTTRWPPRRLRRSTRCRPRRKCTSCWPRSIAIRAGPPRRCRS